MKDSPQKKAYRVVGTGYEWNGTPVIRRQAIVVGLDAVKKLSKCWYDLGLDVRAFPTQADMNKDWIRLIAP